jgi:hypothetical protein
MNAVHEIRLAILPLLHRALGFVASAVCLRINWKRVQLVHLLPLLQAIQGCPLG